jgi:hypothetical protein
MLVGVKQTGPSLPFGGGPVSPEYEELYSFGAAGHDFRQFFRMSVKELPE